jgi:hypothetical protein
MKLSIILLRVAGVVCLIFTISHAMFHKMFNWPETLLCLNLINKAIMLTYHYLIILTIGFMAIVCLFQTKALLKSPIKYSVLAFFSLFYLIRIITEFTLFGTNGPSVFILVLCAIPMVLFAIPIFINTTKH